MVTRTDEPVANRQDAKRGSMAAAGLLATAVGASGGTALAGSITEVTRTTTQEWDSSVAGLQFDVLFDPVENATDLVSISDGSVFTGEAASLVIEAIATDDTTVELFNSGELTPFFETFPLVDFTNNVFTDFSARDIKGLRFTLSASPPTDPRLVLPSGTDFVFAVVVPEPTAGALLAAGLVTVFVGRSLRRRLAKTSHGDRGGTALGRHAGDGEKSR